MIRLFGIYLILFSLAPIEATTTPAPADPRPTTGRRADQADSVEQPTSRVSVESTSQNVENVRTVSGDVSGVSIPALLRRGAEVSPPSPLASSVGASKNNLRSVSSRKSPLEKHTYTK